MEILISRANNATSVSFLSPPNIGHVPFSHVSPLPSFMNLLQRGEMLGSMVSRREREDYRETLVNKFDR